MHVGRGQTVRVVLARFSPKPRAGAAPCLRGSCADLHSVAGERASCTSEAGGDGGTAGDAVGKSPSAAKGDPRGSAPWVGVPRPLPQPWQQWLGQGSFCSKNREVKGCPVAWRVSHPTVGITPHFEYCILLWASHPIVGITPHYRHHTPLWASHPITGIAPHCGHHTLLYALPPILGIASHAHHTPLHVSHPILGFPPRHRHRTPLQLWCSSHPKPHQGADLAALPGSPTPLPGGKASSWPCRPTCPGNITPGNGHGAAFITALLTNGL